MEGSQYRVPSAVFRLITSSNLVGIGTGRSAGCVSGLPGGAISKLRKPCAKPRSRKIDEAARLQRQHILICVDNAHRRRRRLKRTENDLQLAVRDRLRGLI